MSISSRNSRECAAAYTVFLLLQLQKATFNIWKIPFVCMWLYFPTLFRSLYSLKNLHVGNVKSISIFKRIKKCLQKDLCVLEVSWGLTNFNRNVSSPTANKALILKDSCSFFTIAYTLRLKIIQLLKLDTQGTKLESTFSYSTLSHLLVLSWLVTLPFISNRSFQSHTNAETQQVHVTDHQQACTAPLLLLHLSISS